MVNSALYVGSTWHARRGSVQNSFKYRVLTWLIDLDELEELQHRLRIFSVDRRNLYSLRSGDHVLGLSAAGVKDWVADQGFDGEVARVQLMCSPRVLGYVFNPLSVWWCLDAGGTATCAVAEVHNTYGGRHAYLLDLRDGPSVQQDKQLYVSPFYEVDGRYEMRLSQPGVRFNVHIGYLLDDEKVFDATWAGKRRPLDRRTLLGTLVTHPLNTFAVSALIRAQGIKLWRKGLEVVDRRTL
jgi:DUF1365 family protein